MTKPRVSIIGSGISGLIAASTAAKNGCEVDIFEKNAEPGGRIRSMHHRGFTFDMGPSWYWMPDIIEDHFKKFGHTASDFYDLVQLDPSYSVFWKDEPPLRVPADLSEMYDWMEAREPGSSRKMERFLDQARKKYEVGMWDLAQKPMQKPSDYMDFSLVGKAFQMDLFKSMHRHITQFFKDPHIISLLSFPVLFLGGTARQIPALYSLMNYADLKLGTWYPMGGMVKLTEAWHQIATELGVRFHFNEEIREIHVNGDRVKALKTTEKYFPTEALIASGDYHHVEQELLPPYYRHYSESYWQKRTMSPSSLLFYVGVNTKVPGLTHHNLFFDEDLDRHSYSIYTEPEWPRKPLFYVCCPSKTDDSVAPDGFENLFVLIPIAPDLDESPEIHDFYFDLIMQRMEKRLNFNIRPHVLFKKSFGVQDFKREYNSFKGNAYGLANTLNQTAGLKPSMRPKNIENMVYAGQLTVPGPGIPPSLISGRMAADLLTKQIA